MRPSQQTKRSLAVIRALLLALAATLSNEVVVAQSNLTNAFYYDRNDRLVGAEYSRGVSIAYTYDGNGNLVRQTVLSRASETNGLPVLWQFLNGLTNGTASDGLYGDPDNDGWSNYQEWKAGSDPNDRQSTPNLLSNPGSNIVSLALPFTPSNFVVGVGQLDGYGTEEIVIGADGDPGTNTNFLLVLTEGPVGWSTQRVDVGPFGFTSIAIGQPTNRTSTGIYVGLRGTNGSGRIMEFTSNGGSWQSNWIALSTNEAAFVAGIRQNGDVIANLATNGISNALWSLIFSNATWNLSLISSNASQRGIPNHGSVFSRFPRDSTLRLLDAGGIEVIAGDFEVAKDGIVLPTNAVLNPATGKWHFNTPQVTTWDDAQNYFTNYHGSLVTINSEEENNWLVSNLGSEWIASGGWIGLYWQIGDGNPIPYWISGEGVDYQNVDRIHGWDIWGRNPSPPPVTKLNPGTTEFSGSNTWDVLSQQWGPRKGIGQVTNPVVTVTNRWLIQEPTTTSNIVWRNFQLEAGQPRPRIMNQSGLFYCSIDDRNVSGSIDAADMLVFAEYQISNNTVITATVTNVPVGSAALAQSFDLAAVNFLNSGVDTIFTAEPNGGIYSWPAGGASGPLQRQVFTEDYSGKAWHALAGVKMAAGGEGLVGLMVDPTNQSACKVVFWQPQAVLSSPQTRVFQTAPIAQVLPAATPVSGLARVPIRLWDAEGNASRPELQFQLQGSSNWLDALIVLVDGLPYSTNTRVEAPPSGANHVLWWSAAANLAPRTSTNVFVRSRATDVTLTGAWSPPVSYLVEVTSDADTDGDGVSDSQELRNGTNPTVPDLPSLISPILTNESFQATVQGYVGGHYTVQSSTNLIDWTTLTNLVASSPQTNVRDPAAPNFKQRFYRVVIR